MVQVLQITILLLFVEFELAQILLAVVPGLLELLDAVVHVHHFAFILVDLLLVPAATGLRLLKFGVQNSHMLPQIFHLFERFPNISSDFKFETFDESAGVRLV